jgi:ABC-2 type transport system permease protein
MTADMTVLPSLDHLPGRTGMRQVVRAEWFKLRSLRSTTWTLLATVLGSLGVTVLATNSVQRHGPSMGFDPTNHSLTGLALGSLTIGVLGVLAITAEYSSSTIRSTLAATPRRPVLFGAKAIVVGLVSLVVGEVLTFACFAIGQGVLSGRAPTASLSDPGVLRALVLTGAYLALLGLFGLGLGVIIRHTAGAIATYVGVIFLIPIFLQPLSSSGNPGRFAPEQMLANSVAAVVPQSGQVTAPIACLLMVAYCAVVLAAAMMLLRARDA